MGEWVNGVSHFEMSGGAPSVQVTVRIDYQAKSWDLWINGVPEVMNLSFIADTEAFTGYTFLSTPEGGNVLERFEVSTVSPVFADADNDGLPDTFEVSQSGSTTAYTREALFEADVVIWRQFLNAFEGATDSTKANTVSFTADSDSDGESAEAVRYRALRSQLRAFVGRRKAAWNHWISRNRDLSDAERELARQAWESGRGDELDVMRDLARKIRQIQTRLREVAEIVPLQNFSHVSDPERRSFLRAVNRRKHEASRYLNSLGALNQAERDLALREWKSLID